MEFLLEQFKRNKIKVLRTFHNRNYHLNDTNEREEETNKLVNLEYVQVNPIFLVKDTNNNSKAKIPRMHFFFCETTRKEIPILLQI